ncbi:conserved hypothetical protein [Neospora caninum Liverpool]|uniref:Uncharacterized protein n=1 Tax=Neospora caninum (strain Liverpool) TaxID=572307 RepID=F0VQL7_NEOCL|nr:conserved hypothetical protein [Neospora caninum Liverpool]CBZ56014.1 conserved hypothetical protein [Neospora caninum Liverpool]CEL70760.1 TPA: hypothetical protein BN1204_064400 [Neospora caninum Liverpool]|eukprot:XP_003886040.1 conserved hypothetical protein [Neospora caninum Liverpool]
MDGLSRQNFWNELSCCLLLLQNIERYNSYIYDLVRSATGLPALPHMPVGSHGLGNRSSTPLLSENDSQTSPVVSATQCGERRGAAPSTSITAPGQMTGAAFDRSKQRPEGTNDEARHPRTTTSSGKVALPCTRLPDALSSATPLPIPLQMLKIVLLGPRLLAWGYLWERRLLRKVRNPLPVYYPPERFGTEAILGRRKRMPDSGTDSVSTKPKMAKTPADAPKTHQPFTSVIPILVNRDMTTKLLQICKSKKAGLNGLIIGTAAIAISELMWDRRTVLKEIDRMLDDKQSVREAGKTSSQTPEPHGTTHEHGHIWFPFHPMKGSGRAAVAVGTAGVTKQGRDCGLGSHTIPENAQAIVSPQLSNSVEETRASYETPLTASPKHRLHEGPTESIRLSDDAARGRLSPEYQNPIILKASSATHCGNENAADSPGVSFHNIKEQNTRIQGNHLDTGANVAHSVAAHRPSRCRRGPEKQEIALCANLRGRKTWGKWPVVGAGCRQVRYVFEQLRALIRKPTCELDPDRLGASNVKNHSGPVYLYSLQAVSGRRWFKRTERNEFEPTEFEDQMLFQSFLLEQAQASLTQLAPGDPFGLGLFQKMDTRLCDIGRDSQLLSRGKYEENQDTQTSSRRVTLPGFHLPLSPARKPGTRGGVSLSPRRETRERNVDENCYGVTACTALPSPQMCQAVIMDTSSYMRKLPQDCGQSPLVCHHKARPPFATSVPGMLTEHTLALASPTAERCWENVRKSSQETRVPSDSEVTLSRMSTGQDDKMRQQFETNSGGDYSCREIIETATVASKAAQQFVEPETDISSHENPSASEEAAHTLQKVYTTVDKQGTGCQGDTGIIRCGILASSSCSSCWTELAQEHSDPTQKTHASTLPGSSPVSTNSGNERGSGGGASSELQASKGKRPSIRNSLASSLMKIRSWIARKSRGEKRVTNPQPDGRNGHSKFFLEKPGNVICDSQASTTNNAETNVQVTSRAGMGSYALIIPIRIRVSPKCADLKEDLWELASRSAKDVHAIVNAQRPFRASYALVPWHSITVYVGSIIDRMPLLRKLGGMKPNYRPSAFLISNGGKWDVTSVETFMHQLLLEVAHMAKLHRSITVYRLLHHHQLMEERARLMDRKKQGLKVEMGDLMVRNPTSSVTGISGSPNRPSHQRSLDRNSSSPRGTRLSSYAEENMQRAVSTSAHIKRSIRIEEVNGANTPYSRLLHLKTLPRTPTSGRYCAPTKKTSTSTVMAKTVPKFQPFSLKIESSWSVVAQHNVGLNYFAHNVVTVDGCLNWTLQYHTNMVSHELAMCYANRIIDILERVCRGEDLKDNQQVDAKGPHQYTPNLTTMVLPVPRTFGHEAEHPTAIRSCQEGAGGTMRQRLTGASKDSNM